MEKEKSELESRVKELVMKNDDLNAELTKTENEFEKTKKAYLSQDQTATLLQDLVSYTISFLFITTIQKY